jgi:Zn-dependent M28 family amino/carboxypeptidase
MLLVAADELHKNPPARPIAILFTGQEEVGLVGAKAFYEYAVQNDFQVGEVLNFDNIGRGGLAARASGERSGYVFTLPLLGEYVYNGRTVAQASAYRQPDSTLLERIRRRVPFAFFDRMVAKSDGTYWQDHGWNAVNISSDDMYYLDETWHTFGDRIELLDQRNLDRALKLVRDYATREE